MPEDYFALFSSPDTIRRYAALHSKAASILNALASAREAKDFDVANACLSALSKLALAQEKGVGHAPAAA